MMETQIYSYVQTPKGPKVITIFGYATRGVPGIEISGCGKLSKNIKEKLIYMTRARRLKLPTKRFVICIDLNDLEFDLPMSELKWIEFPVLLLFWYLAGLIPIKKLDDCVCAGWIDTRGDIYQTFTPNILEELMKKKVNPVVLKSLKLITTVESESHGLWNIDSSMLLEHIDLLNFKIDYTDKLSATPLNSSIA